MHTNEWIHDMKRFGELKAEMKQPKAQMEDVKKRDRTESLKELREESNFTAGMLKSALAGIGKKL